MNLRLSRFVRLLLVALLLGSEWCGSAQCVEQSNADAQDSAPAISSGLSFGMQQIVLRGRADTLGGLDNSRPLPQDTGHIAACASQLSVAVKRPNGHSLFEDGSVVTESTLVLQHTRLQL